MNNVNWERLTLFVAFVCLSQLSQFAKNRCEPSAEPRIRIFRTCPQLIGGGAETGAGAGAANWSSQVAKSVSKAIDKRILLFVVYDLSLTWAKFVENYENEIVWNHFKNRWKSVEIRWVDWFRWWQQSACRNWTWTLGNSHADTNQVVCPIVFTHVINAIERKKQQQ